MEREKLIMDISCLGFLFNKKQKIIVYGAGLRGNVIVKNLIDFGVNCIAVIDANPKLHGTFLHGVEIFSKDKLYTMDSDTVVLISIANCTTIYKELSQITSSILPIQTGDLVIRLSFLNCESFGFIQLEDISSYMGPYPNLNDYPPKTNNVLDIDLNITVQEKIFNEIVDIYRNIPDLSNEKYILRYYEDNTKYGIIDALVLHSFIRKLNPKRIVEVGSGFTSSVMLDTNEYYFDNKIQLEFIEPYPARLKSLLKPSDNIKLQECILQKADIKSIEKLEKNDILFIDSSHMSKMGSDVNQIFFEILPKLKSGVYIHFHDIFKNFEYPKEWLENGWVWNESYILRAFLTNNNDYEIMFFCDMWNDKFNETRLFDRFVGGANIWIRKK